MKPLDSEGFNNLGDFVDDEFTDSWEQNEGRSEFISDRYSDKNFIASGALKNVFKVYDSKMKREVALAELKEEIPEEEYESFISEARLTSSLRHPNIITVYDFGFNEVHIPFFTMELKVGDTLEDSIKNKSKDLNSLLEIFIKICDAISYAHSQNVVHLDLKPANIQVGKYGEVQVCDWGLSKKAGNLKTEDMIKGTPGFMAPEQIMPGGELDFQTDVFALGAILYSILTGEVSVQGGCKTAIIATIKEAVTPPIERCPDKNIPISLSAVVCRAMEIEKEQRYKNVEELKAEVNKYLMGRSTNAEEAGFIKELQLFVQRNKQVCIISLVFITAIVAGTVIFLLKLQKSNGETQDALEKLKIANVDIQNSRQKEKELFQEKEKAFNLYFQATEERQQMYDKLLDRELRHAYNLMTYPLYFSSPRKNLEQSLEILKSQYNEERPQEGIADLIFLNLFISQKFDELENYKSKRYGSLLPIAQKFKNEERTGLGVFADRKLYEFMLEINKLPESEQSIKKDIMERSICFTLDVRGTQTTVSKIVGQLIKAWNPQWDAELLSYKKSTEVLKISGSDLTTLKPRDLNSSQQCFLRYLKLKELDISATGISSVSHLEGISAEKLDITDSQITSLHPHNAIKSIKKIQIRKGQFSNENEQKIPKGTELIFSN